MDLPDQHTPSAADPPAPPYAEARLRARAADLHAAIDATPATGKHTIWLTTRVLERARTAWSNAHDAGIAADDGGQGWDAPKIDALRTAWRFLGDLLSVATPDDPPTSTPPDVNTLQAAYEAACNASAAADAAFYATRGKPEHERIAAEHRSLAALALSRAAHSDLNAALQRAEAARQAGLARVQDDLADEAARGARGVLRARYGAGERA